MREEVEASGLALGEKKREKQRIKRSVETSSISRLHGFVEPPCYYTDYIFKCAYSGCFLPTLPLSSPPVSSLVFHCSSNIYDPTCSIYFFASLRILWHFRRSFSHGAIFQEAPSPPAPFIFLRRGVRATFTERCGIDDSRRLTTKFHDEFPSTSISALCAYWHGEYLNF